MITTLSSYFNKIKLKFLRTVEDARHPCKRSSEEIESDDDTTIRNPYKPLRKKMCTNRDEPLPHITRTSQFRPTLHWKTRNQPPLASIKEDELAETEVRAVPTHVPTRGLLDRKFLKSKKALDVMEAAMTPHSSSRLLNQEADPSTSFNTIQPRPFTDLKQKSKRSPNDGKILKLHRSPSINGRSESWQRNCKEDNTLCCDTNKKPAAFLSTKRKHTTRMELSIRMEEKKRYRQLLQKCTSNQPHSPHSPSSCTSLLSGSSNSSRSSSSSSVKSVSKCENTSPTSTATSTLHRYESEAKHRKESDSSEDDQRHQSHHKSSAANTSLKEGFRSGRTADASVARSSSLSDGEENCSLGTMVALRCSRRKKPQSVIVIDLCQSDSESSEAISDTDSNSVEIVDEFPHGRTRKSGTPKALYGKKWVGAVYDDHRGDSENKKDEELVLGRKKTLQAFHDKVENRLETLGIICASTGRCKPPAVSKRKSPFVPLAPEMQEEIDDALILFPRSEVLVDRFNIKVTRRDIATLEGLNWLNDQVMNFYLNLIMERSMNNSELPKVYVFSTFFYPKLYQSGYKSISRWTKKVDIFSYDILLLPIYLGVHWCMATVDLRKRQITYYDSMLGTNDSCLELLLGYLKAEHLDKKKIPYRAKGWKLENIKNIPEQMNGSDCGVFSCKFAEYKSRLAALNFTQEDMPYFRRRMVYEIIKAELLTD